MVDPKWLDVHFEASRSQYEAAFWAANLAPASHVLDAGAGSGAFLSLLSEALGRQGKITAIDLASENTAALSHRIEQLQFDTAVEIAQASILHLPFSDSTFDAIWCANTIQYIPQQSLQPLCNEFWRVLKPGGRVAIKEFDNNGLHFSPFEKKLLWHLLEKIGDSKLMHGAGSLQATHLNHYLQDAKFLNINMQSFMTEFQQPLSNIEKEFLESALSLYSELAVENTTDESTCKHWQEQLGDPQSHRYLLRQPDFYFREVHVLATGEKPMTSINQKI